MAGLREGGNEPADSLKAICKHAEGARDAGRWKYCLFQEDEQMGDIVCGNEERSKRKIRSELNIMFTNKNKTRIHMQSTPVE
ncbi:hypothetical protein ANN_00392 [Periplaneta americana]|uniref:Uncharacterized protein n=1 Tax=Periplaneta americana TaxID=6978 RepID=A0ABQ8TTK0_PERAM|nr:hypothetical protein ANN_00392 [Periplaneta americana]